jgi:hypothetical protein
VLLISPSALCPYQAASLLALSWHHILALRECFPQIGKEVGPLLNVLVTKQRCNGPGSFFAVIERNSAKIMLAKFDAESDDGIDLRKDVVDDVVLNNAVEDVAADEAKFTVNSRECTFGVSPRVCLVVGSLGVGVVKVSDRNCYTVRFGCILLCRDELKLTNPVVHPEVRTAGMCSIHPATLTLGTGWRKQ